MATKLPSGSYRAQVFIGIDEKGKRQYKSFTGSTANEADLKALQYKARFSRVNGPNKTLLKASDEFLHLNTKTLSISTQKGYISIHRSLATNYKSFASTPINDIEKKNFQRFINTLSANHSPKTVRNYHSYICKVLKSNDCIVPEVNLPKKKKPQFNIPDESQIQRLFDVVKGTDLEVPVMLGALVPMRRGEIVAAKIEDLSPDNVLHIHSAIAVGDKGITEEKGPKNESSDRFVKLPDELAEKIRAQGYICNISIKALSNRFARALRKSGIEHFRFHDLRHAFVSIAHAAGIPDAYIMARGGWSTSYTVNNVYRHVLDADREKMEKTVNDVFKSFF